MNNKGTLIIPREIPKVLGVLCQKTGTDQIHVCIIHKIIVFYMIPQEPTGGLNYQCLTYLEDWKYTHSQNTGIKSLDYRMLFIPPNLAALLKPYH